MPTFTKAKTGKVTKGVPALPSLHPIGGAAGAVFPDANTWDAVEIDGDLMPGHAKVTGGGIAAKIHHKKAHGRNGDKPTYVGIEAKPLTVTCTVWTDAQVVKLEEMTSKLINAMATDPGNAAFRFDAPAVRGLGIDIVVVHEISPLLETSNRGEKQRTFTLHQFLPPGVYASIGTPTKAKKASGARGENAVEKAAREKKQKEKPSEKPGLLGPTGEPITLKETRADWSAFNLK